MRDGLIRMNSMTLRSSLIFFTVALLAIWFQYGTGSSLVPRVGEDEESVEVVSEVSAHGSVPPVEVLTELPIDEIDLDAENGEVDDKYGDEGGIQLGNSSIAVVHVNGTKVAGSAAGAELPDKEKRFAGKLCTPTSRLDGCGNTIDGCSSKSDGGTNTVIVLLQGNCTFEHKAIVAIKAGATALLIVSHDSPKIMAGLANVSIPVIMVANESAVDVLNTTKTVEFWEYHMAAYDVTEFIMSVIALTVVAVGAWVSTSDLRSDSVIEQPMAEEIVEMSATMVVAFFSVGSCMLMLLYFFMDFAIYFLIFFFCVGGFSAIHILLRPALFKNYTRMQEDAFVVPVFGQLHWADVTTSIFAFVVQSGWVIFRNSRDVGWVFQDITGIFLLLSIQRVLKLPNFQLGFGFLSLFLVFDIFWVFISPLIFEESVMVAVASGGDTGETVPMLLKLPVFGDDLGGSRMLGFGDMALPGLFISYVLRFEMLRAENPPKTFGQSLRQPLFVAALIGYFCGMSVTFIALFLMKRGQPALLYLVPCTFLSLLSSAFSRGEFRELWESSAQIQLQPACGEADAAEPFQPNVESDAAKIAASSGARCLNVKN